jgi:neutral ceramidase
MSRLWMIAIILISVTMDAWGNEPGWRAGVAVRRITPAEPMWMSGYASRDRPAEGTLHDLYAKALVLETRDGQRLILITLDLVGIDRDLSRSIAESLMKRHGLRRSQIAINCSHTHSGPVVRRNLRTMYALDDAQWHRIERYGHGLVGVIDAMVNEALSRLAPAQLSYGTGHASFAVNRRGNREADVPQLRQTGRLRGPVDHDVPVLAVRRPEDGRLIATAFGYACHATTLSGYEWSGDYPGVAQSELQKRYPESVALFWAGCGGDQNPLPRRSIELVASYGRALAGAVSRILDAPMQPIAPHLSHRYAELDLPFDSLPTREALLLRAGSSNRYEAARARLLIEQLDAQRLSPVYPYPIQLWRLGDELRWYFLGGEVVVDYALKLKMMLGRPATWVAAYTNDVMAYIPCERVLEEGGYEGGGAMLYYGQPARWASGIEQRILDSATRLGR